MAEQLCEQYEDTLEPSNVARVVAEAHEEVRRENPHVFLGDEPPRSADSLIVKARRWPR
jgi:hypothetical protein